LNKRQRRHQRPKQDAAKNIELESLHHYILWLSCLASTIWRIFPSVVNVIFYVFVMFFALTLGTDLGGDTDADDSGECLHKVLLIFAALKNLGLRQA